MDQLSKTKFESKIKIDIYDKNNCDCHISQPYSSHPITFLSVDDNDLKVKFSNAKEMYQYIFLTRQTGLLYY